MPILSSKPYRGRFAPSPTGPLHFGSLVAALASYLDARAHGGTWLVRIEDLDAPRTSPGAADAILRCLESCGLFWDENVLYQTQRIPIYLNVFEDLLERGLVYPCACTRREIADSVAGLAASGEVPYPGTCRAGLPPDRAPRAWRLRVENRIVEFEDRRMGRVRQNLERDVGDFIVRRADGPFAYQLAVVVDDCAQGITDVVRGEDLLASTPRQIFLHERLGCAPPRYLHFPVVRDARGEKLSKQTGASPVDYTNPLPTLREALRFLGMLPPEGLSLRELLEWAILRS